MWTRIMPIFSGKNTKILALSALAQLCIAGGAGYVHAQSMGDYSVSPRAVDQGVAPLVMLAMSNDHQLYFKAYTDFDNLDEPGEEGYPGLDEDETTYDNSFEYTGYFSPGHCYAYVTNGDDRYFRISSVATSHYCTGENWSGNFLNWATMTRIDVLRKILYGGKRSVDTASRTILERSYLPNDAHSFAKFYIGDDLSQLTPYGFSDGLTMCNTTLHTNDQKSADNTSVPLMRVVQGNYALWASAERHQCLTSDDIPENSNFPGGTGVAFAETIAGLDISQILSGAGFPAAASAPQKTAVTDFHVFVAACPSAYYQTLSGCIPYGTNLKPEGLLQKYGLSSKIEWGLMTGGYKYNKTGGVLRNNIGDISDDVNADGTFVVAANVAESSIFEVLDAFRIGQWKFSGGNNTSYNENCQWGSTVFAQQDEDSLAALDGKDRCSDWGNPIGEVLAESYRYFAGAQNPTNDPNGLPGREEDVAPPGIIVGEWKSLNTTHYEEDAYSCANLNVLGLNAGAQTFDNNIDDFLAGIKGNPTATNISARTDQVGSDNGVDGLYFIGNNGATNNDSCTAKSLTNLSDASGVCPDAPRKEGSWNIAGLANFVSYIGADEPEEGEEKENRDINEHFEGDQTIRTHGVQLSAILPQVELGLGISFSPYCENMGRFYSSSSDVVSRCALVDFRVLSQGENEGVYYVNWEDSEQGGDFDQDMHGLIRYTLTDGQLQITTQVIGQSTEDRMGFGYTLVGAGAAFDGVKVDSGVNGYIGHQCAPEEGDIASAIAYSNTTPFTVEYPENEPPRYHTEREDLPIALWPGCGINHGPSAPNSVALNQLSAPVKKLNSPLKYAADASCGTFIDNKNPAKLETDLDRVISAIGPTTPSGGGEAAASTTGSGPGLYLHTVYYAKRQYTNDIDECNADIVTWVGQVGALYKDEKKRLREDTVSDRALTDGDRVVEITHLEDDLGNPIVHFFDATAADDAEPVAIGTIDDISYIWSTTETLNNIAPGDRNIYTRVLTELPASGNTHLITATASETVEFEAGNFEDAAAKLLGTTGDAGKLVNYIRGTDDADYRNRTLLNTKYLMGDILASPVIQAAPDYSYYSELGDPDYLAYVDTYKTARKVVYVASNDGMIHAFNAGVGTNNSYSGGDLEGVSYALGEELWAYAPFNLLPHLQWLADTSYQHVPYFDGYMRTFDIKAFNDDGVHKGGWGTILVVGTGLGGGSYPIDFNDDDVVDLTTRPAYIVLDITNRNARKPTVIAEISHEELGFTTVEPDVIRVEKGTESGWYLVFGSGPRGYAAASERAAQLHYQMPDLDNSAPNAQLEKPRLFALKFNKGASQDQAFDPPTLQNPLTIDDAADNAFIGAINGMDWNRDFKDDAIYFGTIAGTQAVPSGKLMRAALTFTSEALTLTPSVMVNTNKPVTKRPVTVINNRNHWVFAGTGRYFAISDAATTNSDNMFLGIIEPKLFVDEVVVPGGVTTTEIELSTLVGTKNIRVAKTGQLQVPSGLNVGGVNQIDGLRQYIANTDSINGWVRYFDANERQHTIAGYLASTLFVTTTVPSNTATCADGGDAGWGYVFDMRSGVYSPYVSSEHTTSAEFTTATGSVTVDEVILPIEIKGGGYDINDPANGIAVGSKSETLKIPELDLDIPSQRHSWREVTIPW